MNNSYFGKTLEYIEGRVDVRLVTDEEKALKLAALRTYECCRICDENLLAVHLRRTKLVYN